MRKTLLLLIVTILVFGCVSTRTNDRHNRDLYVNILKNYYKFYTNFKNPSIILNASIKDIETNNSKWHIPVFYNNEEFQLFISFCRENISHTQLLPEFKNFPGNDPWGEICLENNEKIPSYKKLLPSEMFAMSKYSGSISGKCTTIANFISSVLRLSGISEEDIFIIRLSYHTLGIFKYNNSLYVINNNEIGKIDDLKKTFSECEFYGIYNDRYFSNNNFVFNKNIDISQKSLKDYFEMDLKIKFFKTSLTYNYETLIDYAYQSLNKTNIKDYIYYSLKSPHAVELAAKIKDEEEILSYIKDNIENASIFPDSKNRIMLPDQVIVFGKGDYKDQALLFLTLLKLNGKKAIINISEDNASVEFDNKKINFPKKKY